MVVESAWTLGSSAAPMNPPRCHPQKPPPWANALVPMPVARPARTVAVAARQKKRRRGLSPPIRRLFETHALHRAACIFWPRRNEAVIHCLTTYGWAGPWAWPFLLVAITLKLAVWALIVTGLIFAVRWFRRQTPGHLSTPLEILRARYARGELSRQDFESMRQDLER